MILLSYVLDIIAFVHVPLILCECERTLVFVDFDNLTINERRNVAKWILLLMADFHLVDVFCNVLLFSL